MDTSQSIVKTALEIGTLSGSLTHLNQSYVLNTISALLFSQQAGEKEGDKKGA